MTKDSRDTGARLAELDDIGLRTATPWSELDAIAAAASSLLDAPIALISVLDDSRQVLKGAHGVPASVVASRVTAVSPMCRQVVASGRPVVVQDARNRSPQPGDDAIVALRIGGYLGVPLSLPNGTCFAALAAISPRPRTWNDRDVEILRALGATAMAIIERKQVERRYERLEETLRLERSARELMLRGAFGAESAATRQPLLDALALHDELTGLLNRRGFFVVAESHLAIARRKLLPGMLLFVDLDGLKRTNDRFGHAAGDDLLREAGAALRATFRDADTVARLGGDEFVVLSLEAEAVDLPAIDGRLAAELVRVNQRRVPSLPLAWSVGVVAFEPGRDQSLGALMLEADRRMYEAKRRVGA
jgi:diguanylate cyclase (GGDEF)-like protein